MYKIRIRQYGKKDIFIVDIDETDPYEVISTSEDNNSLSTIFTKEAMLSVLRTVMFHFPLAVISIEPQV